MGFLSAQYKQQIQDEDKKKQSSQSQKPGKSILSRASDIGSTVGKFVASNTGKFVNQAVQEGKQAVDATKQVTASATNNPEAFRNAQEQSKKDYKGFKSSGGLFNVGTLTNEQEAQSGDLATGARKIGAGTVGIASEIAPLAKGFTLAKEGGKLLPNLVRAGVEGAGYGAVGDAAQQYGANGKVDLTDTAKNALLGGVTGTAGFGIGKFLSKGTDNVLTKKMVTEAPVSKSKSIPVTGGDESPTIGQITTGIPTTARPAYEPLKSTSPSDTDFRLRFNDQAKEVVKNNSSFAKQYLKTGSKDPTTLLISHIVDNNSSKDTSSLIDKLIPNIDNPDKTKLVKSLNKSNDSAKIKDLLYTASENTNNKNEIGNEVISPYKNISFATDQAKKFSSALTSDSTRDTATQAGINAALDQNGNYTSGPLKGQPPLTTLANVDTRTTSPTEAKNRIALEAVNKPTISASIEAPQRAKAALVGESSYSTEKPTTAVGEGAQSIAEKLNEQLKTFDDKFAAPEEIKNKLKGLDVSTPARKHDWLNHYEDTLSVLGRHFGKQGTDLGYKLAEGAKQVSDIQEVVRPSIDKTQKLLNQLAKSKAGKADIQDRVYSALSDRANADSYLKNPKEKELYDETVKVFDYFKDERVKRGKAVIGEDYSPRAAVRSALDAPERLLDNARIAFGRDVQSKFSKKRVAKIPDAEINRNIIDLLPSYASSQSKEFGYEGALEYAQKELPNINPAYITDAKSTRQGQEYLRNLFSQVLDPPTMSKSEKFQNKLIANTYKNQLGLSPKFAFQNMSQRFATKAAVSKQANKLAGGGTGRFSADQRIDAADLDLLRKESFSNSNPITSEATQTSENSTAKSDSFFSRIDPGQRVERKNVAGAFDRGAAQAILESGPYKDAIKNGFSPKDASKFALKDNTVRDLAVRRGNIVVNDTQFGANFVTKPEFFRKSGTFFGLSDKWYKQYQRFPQGMIQNISTTLRANDARALDILKRGNPAETNLVDYRKSAQALHAGVEDIVKGIKNGEISDVSLEVAQGYQKSLSKAIDELNKEMKKVSQVRTGKTIKNLGKMWAAASAVQFLFDGGLSMNETDQNKELRKSVQFGAPVSIPTRDQNPLAGAIVPSSPFRGTSFRPEKVTNFIPGVGLAVNRGREISKFAKALTGQQ